MFYYITISITVIVALRFFYCKSYKKINFSWKFWSHKPKHESIAIEKRPIPQINDTAKIDEDTELKKTYEKELAPLAIGTLKIQCHYYTSTYGKNVSSNSKKIKRLTQELKTISNFLPIYFSNAIFVRHDEERMDVMKSIIMGAEDTPYAHGAFLYDIYFDETYPASPPKVNLMTNGGNKVRFNPNLYNLGYVCLSLLGTWSGGKGETWSDKSNLLQVLISIQSLVMTEGIIYNEPSYANGKTNPVYRRQDIGYTNIVKYANVKYAMNGMLALPPTGFEDVIKKHFYYKKNEILKTCNKWLEEAQNPKEAPDYAGLTSSHNYELANLFGKSKDAYYNELAKEVEILRNKLNTLNS